MKSLKYHIWNNGDRSVGISGLSNEVNLVFETPIESDLYPEMESDIDKLFRKFVQDLSKIIDSDFEMNIMSDEEYQNQCEETDLDWSDDSQLYVDLNSFDYVKKFGGF